LSGPLQFVAVTVIMTAGSLVQGSIGFGMGLLAVPFLVLIDPALVPGPILFVSGALSVLMLIRERHGVQRQDLAWSLVGRVGGTALAAAVLLIVPGDKLEVLFGSLILIATALTASGWHLPVTPTNLTGAGFLSGFMATAVSIGGPPMALLYHRQDGPKLRATLSAFFVFGTVISLTVLHFVGRFGWRELLMALGLVPGIVLGFALSIQMTRKLDGKALRPTILGVCAITGLVVLIEAIRAW